MFAPFATWHRLEDLPKLWPSTDRKLRKKAVIGAFFLAAAEVAAYGPEALKDLRTYTLLYYTVLLDYTSLYIVLYFAIVQRFFLTSTYIFRPYNLMLCTPQKSGVIFCLM